MVQFTLGVRVKSGESLPPPVARCSLIALICTTPHSLLHMGAPNHSVMGSLYGRPTQPNPTVTYKFQQGS